MCVNIVFKKTKKNIYTNKNYKNHPKRGISNDVALLHSLIVCHLTSFKIDIIQVRRNLRIIFDLGLDECNGVGVLDLVHDCRAFQIFHKDIDIVAA
jgi:hypothetical protein